MMTSFHSVRAGLLLLPILALACGRCPEKSEAPSTGDTTLKLAGVFTTPIEEPWATVIHQACLQAENELGVHYEWTESVPNPDVERVVREFAGRGFDLIIGDAFGNEEAVRRVARDFPKTAFCFGSGRGPVPPNFSVFDDWIHEPAYLCGMLAGKLTKTNTVGVVGGYSVPEVNRLVNAFIAGAKAANPAARVKVIFINSWFDPPKAKEAVRAGAALGADVFYAERYGAIEAVKELNLLAFGNILPQASLAPDHVVTGPVWKMFPTIGSIVRSIREGTYSARNYAEWSMMKKGGAELAPYGKFEEKLSPELKARVEEKTKEILSGSFVVPVNEGIPTSD